MEKIYLDHAATTPVAPEVFEAMTPYLEEKYGNPSSLYQKGQEAKRAIESARAVVADFIGAAPEEIIFLSGGTEADNFALKGIAYANKERGDHIITSVTEHHAVLEPAHFLEAQDFKVTYLPVDSQGFVDPEQVAEAITDRTILISIMHANNEIGTLQPIGEIGRIARERGVYFHTDAVQSFGHLPLNIEELNVDILSVSAHKLYGPKGVGMIFIRKGTRIVPFMQGGGQERNLRASTLNVPGIIGLAKAVELAIDEMDGEITKLTGLRDYLIDELVSRIEQVTVNGSLEQRLPNNVNVCFDAIEGESMLMALDGQGISVSSGSACTSGSVEPSHVLTAIGVPPDIAHGSLRMTLGRSTTKEEVATALDMIVQTVANLRAMSPVWNR